MLTFKPQNRPTADQCKNHEWVAKQGPAIGRALHDAVVAKLQKFQNFNKVSEMMNERKKKKSRGLK